jgi:hypothetical protein
MSANQQLLSSIGVGPQNYDLALGHDTTPRLSIYKFNTTTGFGTRYSDPATVPQGNVVGVRFSPLGNSLAVTCGPGTGNPLAGYPWTLGSGFGTKFGNPGTLPPSSQAKGLGMTPAGDAVVIPLDTSPYVVAYTWSTSTGYGTKYSDPATLPGGTTCFAAFFNPAGNIVVLGSAGTPFVQAYPWSFGSGFGVKYANPSTLPSGQVRGGSFSPDGSTIAIGVVGGTPIAYPWSSGFGSKYADPSVTMSSSYTAIFHPSGASIACSAAFTPSPSLFVYPWSSGWGTRYSNPVGMPTTSSAPAFEQAVAFNSAGDTIAWAAQATPFIYAYPWSQSTGFGTKYANPGTLPVDLGNAIVFSPAY